MKLHKGQELRCDCVFIDYDNIANTPIFFEIKYN